MIGVIRELPDWMTGTVVAGALWVGVCYVVLAPRAMGAHLETEVTPSCIAALTGEQDAAIAEAAREAEESRDTLRRQLHAANQERAAIEALIGSTRASGLGPFMDVLSGGAMATHGALLSQLKNKSADLEARLSIAPDFSHLRASGAEMARICGCAGLKAAASERTAYALSLASFRLIAPAEINQIGARAHSIAGLDNSCGVKPWRAP